MYCRLLNVEYFPRKQDSDQRLKDRSLFTPPRGSFKRHYTCMICSIFFCSWQLRTFHENFDFLPTEKRWLYRTSAKRVQTVALTWWSSSAAPATSTDTRLPMDTSMSFVCRTMHIVRLSGVNLFLKTGSRGQGRRTHLWMTFLIPKKFYLSQI